MRSPHRPCWVHSGWAPSPIYPTQSRCPPVFLSPELCACLRMTELPGLLGLAAKQPLCGEWPCPWSLAAYETCERAGVGFTSEEAQKPPDTRLSFGPLGFTLSYIFNPVATAPLLT